MDLNNSITVNVLNNEETERSMPLLVYFGIIMLLGIPGNILVIVIYGRNAAKCTYTFFVTYLAVADCIACCVVPFVIYETVHQYTYQENWLCKVTEFLKCWPTSISAGTLCVICIDRYRMICTPHGRQITNKMAKFILAITVFLSGLFACNLLVLMGAREIPIHSYNVTGIRCTILPEYDDTVYFKSFNGILWIMFVTGLTTIVVLYIFIGKQIFHHTKRGNSETSTTNTLNSKSEDSVGGRESNKPRASYTRNERNDMSDISMEIEVARLQTDDSGSTIIENEIDNVNSAEYHGKHSATKCFSRVSRMQSKKESKARQSVYIIFVISVLFVLTFLPFLILSLIEAVNVDLVNTLSDDARAIYNSFRKSYFLNSAVNPIVYCACAPKFRKQAKALMFGTIRNCFRR